MYFSIITNMVHRKRCKHSALTERRQLTSKRYPPIFNVILFALAVIFMLPNPIVNMIPWLPDAIKTAVTVAIYAIYNFFNTAGKFIVDIYNKYAIFTLHVVIIALYGEHLFSKDVKTRCHAALKTIGEYKPKETHFGDESYTKVIKAEKEHDDIVATIYSLSALVLSILITNILVPNFYQFTMTQCWGIDSSDTAMIGALCFGSTLIAAFTIGFIIVFTLIFSMFKLVDVPRPCLDD